MDEFKKKFARDCERVWLPKHDVGPFYVTPREEGREESLIIGTYENLTHLAGQLRVSAKLQKEMDAIGVRYGTREEDRSPLLGTQKNLPERETAPDILFNRIMKLQEKWGHARDGDINPAVKAAQATKTLQAHHMVEKKIINNLGRDTGLLAPEIAPAVLIVAELHLRDFTSKITSEDRAAFTKEMKTEDAVRIMEQLFPGELQKGGKREGGLYSRPGLKSLIAPTLGVIREIERTKPKP